MFLPTKLPTSRKRIIQLFVSLIKTLKTHPNRFVKTNSARGFTLIEMLLSLAVFLIIVFFIVSTIPHLRFHQIGDTTAAEMEWNLFLQQAKMEVREALAIRISDNKLFFLKETKENGKVVFEWIRYEQYNDVLRRRVDGSGHEILLYGVISFQCTPVNKGVHLTVFHENGYTYKTTIYLPQDVALDTE